MVRKSATVVAYVPRKMKKRMEELQEVDRRLTQSRMIEEALAPYLQTKVAELLPDPGAPGEERSH